MKTSQQNFMNRWRKIFRHRSRKHDPLLVLNMSIFNFARGWDRLLNRSRVIN